MAKKEPEFKAVQKKGSSDKGVKIAPKAPKSPPKTPKGKC